MKKLFLLITLFFIQSLILSAQNIGTITGKLIDQNGNGLSGLQLQLYISPQVYNTTSGSDGSFTFNNVTDVKDEQLPVGYAISNNYPNPFNPKTRIGITLPNSGSVRVDIYNLLGQKVRDEIERYFNAGDSYIDLELNGLPNGFYIARITLDDKYIVTKKLMLMYGSQHLSSSSVGLFSRLNKTTMDGNSILDTKIDSLVITGFSIVKKVFTNLPDMVGIYLNLGSLTITVFTPAPPSPILITPSNGATNLPTSILLNWNASSSATSYTLQVSTYNSFSSYIFNQSGLTNTSQQIIGMSNSTQYYWRVNATNSYGTSSWSNTFSFSTAILPCPGIPSITYAGKTYTTVQIGNQCWLRENLDLGTMILGNQAPSNNGVIEKHCYDDKTEHCDIFGGLYQWNEAMQYVTSEKTQGICPSGWHIPTLNEFQLLKNEVSDNGNTLKSIGQGVGDGVGTNISGFSLLLAGYLFANSYFSEINSHTIILSSTENNLISAYYMTLNSPSSDINFYFSNKTNGYSVRCVKD